MYEILGTTILFLLKLSLAVAIGWGLRGYVSQFHSFKELINDLFQ